MMKRRLTTLAVVALGVAALAGCGSKSTTPPASSGSTVPTPTTVTPVTSSGNGYGNGY